ncbi:MAG: hypothetical protein AAGI11_19815 [Pseudomonadota bacterium]
MIEDYLKAASELKTRNQFNRVHINLNRIMTPEQCAELIAAQRQGRLFKSSGPWLDSLQRLSPDIDTSPEPWVAEPINEHMTWYQAGDADAQEGKALLIAFCGKADLLFVALPTFLQALPARDWHVLRITHHGRKGSVTPGDEVPALHALLDQITAITAQYDHPHTACVGTSSGGYIAMLVAMHLEAQRCVAFSGSLPERWVKIMPELSGGKLPLRPGEDANLPEYVFVYGELNQRDQRNAEIARLVLSGHDMSVPGVRSHNSLYPIARRGLLREAFFSMFGGFTAGSAPAQSAPGAGSQGHG